MNTSTQAVNNPNGSGAIRGEAENADGTLKDASEIQWYNSPSDENPIAGVPKRKSRSASLTEDSADDADGDSENLPSAELGSQRHKKQKVSLQVYTASLRLY